MSSRTITLSPSLASGSFPFDTKQLHVSSDPVFLGSADQTGRQGEPSRKAESHNGWFGPKENTKPAGEDIYPLSLGGMHARVWVNGSRVFIRDLETAFGTYVNGARIAQDVELKSGDVVTLGSKIPRNSNTPANITDDHLKPVIAVVTII